MLRVPSLAVRSFVLVGALLGAASVAAACAQAGEAPMPTGAAAGDRELLDGRATYMMNCQRCHGPTGTGGAGPKLAGRMVSAYPDPLTQAAVVANGKGAMPAWRSSLSAEQIAAVVRYTRDVL